MGGAAAESRTRAQGSPLPDPLGVPAEAQLRWLINPAPQLQSRAPAGVDTRGLSEATRGRSVVTLRLTVQRLSRRLNIRRASFVEEPATNIEWIGLQTHGSSVSFAPLAPVLRALGGSKLLNPAPQLLSEPTV